jgi:tetratricopeptide (TPR) repeat protein
VYQENSRFAEAVVSFRKAIEVQPEDFANHQDLCSLYTQQAAYADAIEECRKMVRLVPDFSDAHFALAIPYFESGDYVRSESEFQLAIGLDPMSAKAVYARAFALTSQGRWEEAIPLFQHAIEIGPPTHLLYSDLGTAYRLGGQPVSAAEAYRDGLKLANSQLEKNPRDAIVRAQLAYLCAQVGERGRARSEAIQARQLAPRSVEVAWWLVLAWDSLMEPNEAFALLERMPEAILRRINRETDLANLRRSSRFQQLLTSRNIH